MRAITVSAKTVLSGIKARTVLDDFSSVVGVEQEVQSNFELNPGNSRNFCPTKFIQIKSNEEISITINNTIKIKSRMFIAMSDITNITISNDTDSQILVYVIYG